MVTPFVFMLIIGTVFNFLTSTPHKTNTAANAMESVAVNKIPAPITSNRIVFPFIIAVSFFVKNAASNRTAAADILMK